MSTSKSLSAGDALPPLALIAGPTASGKSARAVELALLLQAQGREAVVINADSAQVYADLAVLSARPAADEMQGVEHRLFGEWDGSVACSAADWAARARAEIAASHARGTVPILVGGTGLYLQTLLFGIAPVPPINPEIRSAVRALPVAEAYAALLCEDPARAALLAATDTTRVIRALEVIRSSGRSLADWQTKRVGGITAKVTLHPLILLPPRAQLYARCDQRFAAMLMRGAIGEVEALLARRLDPALPVMRAIGVAQVAALLRGKSDLAATIARSTQATRNFAKRQITWFRNQPPSDWVRAMSLDYDISRYFALLLRN